MSIEEEIKKAALDKKKSEIEKDLAERDKIRKEIEKLEAEKMDIDSKRRVSWWWRTNFLQFFTIIGSVYAVFAFVYVPYNEKKDALELKIQAVKQQKQDFLDAKKAAEDAESKYKRRIENDSLAAIIKAASDKNQESYRLVQDKIAELEKRKKIIADKDNEIEKLKGQIGQSIDEIKNPEVPKRLWTKENHLLRLSRFVDYDHLRIGLIETQSQSGRAMFNVNKANTMALDFFKSVFPGEEFSVIRDDGRYVIRYIAPDNDGNAIFDISKYSK